MKRKLNHGRYRTSRPNGCGLRSRGRRRGLLDEKELALRYIEAQAGLATNQNLAWALLVPVLDPIRCDPRFLAAVGKVAIVDPRARTVCAGR